MQSATQENKGCEGSLPRGVTRAVVFGLCLKREASLKGDKEEQVFQERTDKHRNGESNILPRERQVVCVGHRGLTCRGTDREQDGYGETLEHENRKDLRTFHLFHSLLPRTPSEPLAGLPYPDWGALFFFELRNAQVLGSATCDNKQSKYQQINITIQCSVHSASAPHRHPGTFSL